MFECRSMGFRHPGATADITADFSVEAGRSLALMGPSGCGKTTVLNLIAGFLTPRSGDILLDHRSLVGLRPAERPLTYLFQSDNLFPHLSAWENVALGIHPGLRVNAEQRRAIGDALSRVGLNGLADALPTRLSGGQRQRVALARCIVRRRPLLLLDEPFSGLDRERRDDILALIRTLQAEQQLHLIIATHQAEDAADLDASIFHPGANNSDWKRSQ